MSSTNLSSKSPAADRAPEIVARLQARYPDAHCSLDFNSPLELLVATILAAQCTDERVNKVTAQLFRKYRSAADYADADLAELEQDVHATGFFRNKAKNIKAMGTRLVEHYHGQVPNNMTDLLTLPGVARKTSNVVLGNAFGIIEGVVVDTHMRRIAQRLGFTKHDEPEKIEQDLMKVVPKKDWLDFSHMVIYLGRDLCKAKPRCRECPVNTLCPARQDN